LDNEGLRGLLISSAPDVATLPRHRLADDLPAIMRASGEEARAEPAAAGRKGTEPRSTGNRSPAHRRRSCCGKPAHVTLVDRDGNKRYIHGIATWFSQNEHRCTAELRPWIWMLALTSDCRIFQNTTVPDILTAVFGDCGQTDYRNSLALSYSSIDYCVQFQETAFDFVSRLMEEEAGIAYYFDHSESAHTLVMIDDPSKYPACPHADSLPFLPLPDDRDWLTDMPISSANLSQRVATAKFQTDDYNFITPSTELKATAGNGSWQVYEYPGRYTAKSDGDTVAKRRMEKIEALVKQLSGTFAMTRHPSDAFNGKYALYSVHHSVSAWYERLKGRPW
jgi:type VI secretion system secreted protein VgrG